MEPSHVLLVLFLVVAVAHVGANLDKQKKLQHLCFKASHEKIDKGMRESFSATKSKKGRKKRTAEAGAKAEARAVAKAAKAAKAEAAA